MTDGKRIRQLDYAKGIGIILVILGHCGYVSEPINRVIFSFHMPLFFVIAGILLHEREGVLKQKARYYLIPYAAFGLLQILYEGVFRWLIRGVIDGIEVRNLFVSLLSLDGISVLWFLPALFIAEAVVLGINRVSGGNLIVKTLMVALLTVLAHILWGLIGRGLVELSDIDNARHTQASVLLQFAAGLCRTWLRGIMCSASVFFGTLLREKVVGKEILTHMFALPKWASVLTGFLLLGITSLLALSNETVGIRYLMFGKPIFSLSAAAFGSLSVLLLANAIPEGKGILGMPSEVLGWCGVNSLLIMVTHLDFRFILIGSRAAETVKELAGNDGVVAVVAFWVIFIGIVGGLLYLTVWIIKKWFPVLTGKKKSGQEG